MGDYNYEFVDPDSGEFVEKEDRETGKSVVLSHFFEAFFYIRD